MRGPRPGTPDIHGLMAEFHTPHDVVEAAHRAHAQGFKKVDAYSPYPMEELSEALDFHHSPLPLMVLVGGIVGMVAVYGLQYWSAVIEYPMNIGGRPLHSWPAFTIPAFEGTILFASLTAVLGLLALCGLPEPYHPVFNVPGFALASRDKFFLCIEARDKHFDLARTRAFLESLPGVTEVSEVQH
jgi:hypothetical protein